MNSCFGLTGGIGSGKSTVARWLGELGARIIDTDELSRHITAADGLAMPDILKGFGKEYIDSSGAMDRNKMRALVFHDVAAKQRLLDILHPMILALSKGLATAPTSAPYTLVVVPLLFESGRYRDWLQRVIVVDCPETAQVERTMRRSEITEAEVRTIMSQQMGRASRLRLADDIIANDGSLEQLQQRTQALHRRLIYA